MKTAMMILLACLVIPCAFLAAQPSQEDEASLSSDALAERVQTALDGERTDEAIRLLEFGKRSFPASSWFPETLGDLYSDKELYELALSEFLGAWKASPGGSELAYKTATTYGYLNRESDSIDWLGRTIALDPENLDAIGDLGWMYFKVHRLDEGVKLLLDAGIKHGMNRSFAMTLGTLYSELFDYENSKRYYLDAIRDAEKDDARTFLAIAYYNLSLLEERWYRYPEALRLTDESLAVYDRASGHLARGELFQQRQEFTQAFDEYQKAFSIDASPLSKINLADSCVEAGRLDEAERWIKEAKTHPSASWMLNFGTDSVQFQKDLHEIQERLYLGLANREGLRPKRDLIDAIISFFRSLFYRLASWYHSELFKKHSETTARAYLRENSRLSAMANFYNAFKGNPGIAKKYLREAERIETALVEKSKASYALEMAMLEQSTNAIAAVIPTLDPEWERDLLVEAWAALAAPGSPGAERAAAELYAINRGAPLRFGIRLPAVVRVVDSANGPRDSLARDAASLIKASFLRTPLQGRPSFALEIGRTETGLEARLFGNSGIELCAANIDVKGPDAAFRAADFFMAELFRAK